MLYILQYYLLYMKLGMLFTCAISKASSFISAIKQNSITDL